MRHDSGKEKEAGNCEDERCSVHRITYNTDLDKIAALTKVSSKCQQHIRVSICCVNVSSLVIPKTTKSAFTDVLLFAQQ